MSAQWLALALGPIFGAFAGALMGSTGLACWQLRRDRPNCLPEVSTEAVRQSVESTFATHASAVARQVTAFADELAAGDRVLRERLRRLEPPSGGGRQ